MPDQSLIRNPHARLGLQRSGEEITSIQVVAPVRGRGLQTAHVRREQQPELFGALTEYLALSSRGLEAYVETPEPLAALGLLIPPDEVSRPVAFECQLEADAALAPDTADCVVSSSFGHQPRGVPPPDALLRKLRLEDSLLWGTSREWFLPASARAWVEDPGTRMVHVYSVPERFEADLAALVPGEAPPASLGAEVRGALRRAGMLLPRGEETRQRDAWEARLQEARARYEANAYVNLSDFVPPLQLQAIQRFYRELVTEGRARYNAQPPVSHCGYNEVLSRVLHVQLTSLISRVVGVELKPSFAFFRTYLPGAWVARHVDRPAAEYSMSFLVDTSPTPQPRSPWPLCFEPEGGPVGQVFQAPGDGVIFRGTQTPHWRAEMPDTLASSTSIFFDYVPVTAPDPAY